MAAELKESLQAGIVVPFQILIPAIPPQQLHFDPDPIRGIPHRILLGEGGFGRVYAGRYQNHPVAVKSLHIHDQKLTRDLQKEAATMFRLASPYTVALHGIYVAADETALVMERMMGGSLFHLLRRDEQDLPWPLRYRLAYEMAEGVWALHQLQIVHRDLKSMNVLLDDDLHAKISDFGFAKLRGQISSMSASSIHSVGTPAYKAPEIVALDMEGGDEEAVVAEGKPNPYSPQSDMYAYGVILWELATRKMPFAGKNPMAVLMMLSRGKTETIPADCPPALAALIESCWEIQPEKRPRTDLVVTQTKALYRKHTAQTPWHTLLADIAGLARKHGLQRKVFISYAWPPAGAERDALQAWLKRLEEDLQRAGIEVFLDVSDIQGNMDATMEQNLRDSDFVMPILTPGFLKRVQEVGQKPNNLQFEFGLMMAKAQANPHCLLPILHEGKFSDVVLKEPLAPLAKHLVYTLSAQTRLESYLVGLSDPLGLIPVIYGLKNDGKQPYRQEYQALLETWQATSLTRLPQPAAGLAARPELMERLVAGFGQSVGPAAVAAAGASLQVLQGEPGVGKTQLALAYAQQYAYAKDFVHVIAASRDSLEDEWLHLGKCLGVELKGLAANQQRQAIREALRQREDWLIILDDLENSAALKGLLPAHLSPTQHVLITSCSQDWDICPLIVVPARRVDKEPQGPCPPNLVALSGAAEAAAGRGLFPAPKPSAGRGAPLGSGRGAGVPGADEEKVPAAAVRPAPANPAHIAALTDLLKQGGCDEALTELRKIAKGDLKPWQAKAIAASEQMAALLAKNPVLANSVELFLLYVAAGCQAQAEAMLRANPGLAELPGSVTDLSGRTFEHITGFQYAVWALDWHMWKMIYDLEKPRGKQGYLRADQAAAQIAEMADGHWVRTHGLSFSFEPLINALDTYVKNYQPWSFEQLEKHWCQQVGGAQLWLPAHAVHEYCRGDRSFDPTPNFLELTLPRTMKTDEGVWLTAEYNGGKLGVKFGVLRYSFDAAHAHGGLSAKCRGGSCADHSSLVALEKTRVQQQKELVSSLGIAQAPAGLRL